MDGFGGRVHVEVRYTGKISEMPAAPETVAARAVVAVTCREPGAQAPVRAFTARGALFASRSWWRRLKG